MEESRGRIDDHFTYLNLLSASSTGKTNISVEYFFNGFLKFTPNAFVKVTTYLFKFVILYIFPIFFFKLNTFSFCSHCV